MNLSTFCAPRHVKYDWNGQNEPPRGSFWCSWRGLGHWGILGDLYFQKWAPRLDGSTIFETCTSNNGKRVTEGAYSFAWDEERAGRESEKTRREAKERITTRYLIPSYTRAWRHESKTASRLESPRAWVHESMRVREHEGSRARKRESMTSWDGLTCALRALVGDVEGGCILIANYNPSIFTI